MNLLLNQVMIHFNTWISCPLFRQVHTDAQSAMLETKVVEELTMFYEQWIGLSSFPINKLIMVEIHLHMFRFKYISLCK